MTKNFYPKWHKNCKEWWCPIIDHALRYMSELSVALDWGAPIEYCRPWWSQDRYFEHSTFLPKLNNEFPEKREVYKECMTKVKNFAMFKWTGDEVISPPNTSWFFTWDKERNSIPLKDIAQYEEDWIGLRTLYESDRLFFYKGRGGHMNLEL